MLPTGKLIRPIGTHVEVGSYPSNMILSPDGRFAVVSTMGFREYLSVISTDNGKLVSQLPFNKENGDKPRDGLYYGLSFAPNGTLFVSHGGQDLIGRFKLSSAGALTSAGNPISNPAPKDSVQPYFPAGIGTTSQGLLVVANNETTYQTDYRGSVSVIDPNSGKELKHIPCAGFPYGIAVLTKGPRRDAIAYVGGERDGVVDVVDLNAGRVKKSIRVGASPVQLLLNKSQSRLFVANSASDTVSVIDTAVGRVIDTILLRPSDLSGLPGAGPLGLCLSPDEKRLYVTLSDMNAVGVVDLKKRSLIGMFPTGWLPTSVLVTKNGLLVASAKGVKTQHPNNKPVGDLGQYIQDLITGTVTKVDTPGDARLQSLTATVVANNRLRLGLDKPTHPNLPNPGIKYVIYVIKENRTYDNVLGDLPQGNGDSSICIFPRKVTPNLHALAERFVLLDNFHVCAEVSQDGWVWSTAGMIGAYASRNTPYNYSDRGRNYDTEGSNNGIPVDLIDIPDATRPPSGYIWEQCKKEKVSYRNFGFFTQFIEPLDKRHDVMKTSKDNVPAKKALQGMTDENFRRYDLQYADSEAHLRYNWNWPKQRKTFGKFNSPSRFSEWNREFQACVAKGVMPRFQMIRMGNDHTSGTAEGQPAPTAMAADNDFGVGQLVEAVSKSPFWKETLICVIEDDAQAGYDHVDAHRSTAYLVSPYIKKGTIDSHFYNTDSMLRTMELMLGMKPMSQYDAVASPISVFGSTLSNAEPYTAILPDREIVCQVNKSTAYRSRDSKRISNYVEESLVDEDLNDILWGSIKGARVPRPAVRKGLQFMPEDDD